MQFAYVSLAGCAEAHGAVVVIDVIRAFTTAAYAFGRGAQRILLTRTVEEALALRRRFPQAWVMGEVEGIKPQGFDFGNSPAQIDAVDLNGRTLIQRTSSGTQGAVLSVQADLLLACSFANAGATAAFLRQQSVERVTFAVTGAWPGEDFATPQIRQGDEDAACAHYLQAWLESAARRTNPPDAQPFLERVRKALAANKFLNPEQSDFSPIDLDYCTRLDAFQFVMRVQRQEDLLILQAQPLA